MNRAEVLDIAKKYVTADRQNDHGRPEDTFRLIADLWNAYLGEWADIKPHDVAALMALLKIARLRVNHSHEDNWVDLAGYAACGAELAAPPPKLYTDVQSVKEKPEFVWDQPE